MAVVVHGDGSFCHEPYTVKRLERRKPISKVGNVTTYVYIISCKKSTELNRIKNSYTLPFMSYIKRIGTKKEKMNKIEKSRDVFL